MTSLTRRIQKLEERALAQWLCAASSEELDCWLQSLTKEELMEVYLASMPDEEQQ